jgi:hypothetical protein
MARRESYGYQGAYKRSGASCRDPDGDPDHCGLHWGEAKREQHRVLAPPIGVHVVQQIGGKRSCERYCRRADYSEESERLRKVPDWVWRS